MRITESREKQRIILFVSGVVNQAVSTQLQSEIFRALKVNKNIVLDFKEVETIDDAGIVVLQAGMKAASGNRGTFELRSANNIVKNAVRTAGIGRIITF
ncbi:MAG: STAS domain-containing protein [Oscillospiraceae bacterium]|nr:STAS domain-containing protein [Oscillospiraceae bacterium]